MSAAKRWFAHFRWQARRMGPRGRVIAVALAVLAVAGMLWLARDVFRAGPDLVAVFAEPLGPGELATARELARIRQIPHRLEGGRLLAGREHVDELRAALAAEGIGGKQATLTFDQLARENDLWRSSAQNAKRWQAAKMAVLSDLVKQFPTVRDATVLFEMGSSRTFGAEASRPTAAVKLTLASGERMTHRLAGAVADLVAGSIVGMRRQDVRVVDDAGHSFRIDDAATGEDPIERVRAAEAYYAEKIRSAVRYTGGAVVSASADGAAARCIGASVSVPRSYLAAAYRSARGADDPNDAELAAFAGEAMERLCKAAATAAGVDASAVRVSWHYDAPASTASAGPAAAGAEAVADLRPMTTCVGLALGGVFCGLLAMLRRRLRQASGAEEGAAAAAAAAAATAQAEDPMAFLRRMGPAELFSVLHGEHPQTTALVLSHVEAAAAAGVMGQLEPAQQVDVARRIAELERVDPEVTAEVARGLVRRVSPATSVAVGGVGKVARILHHAGFATEQTVLDALAGQQPNLAEQIRKSMFVFEDLSLLPAAVLAGALESVKSEELAVALRTAGSEVKDKVLGSLSREASRLVRRQMDEIGPVRLSDVEAAQERVVAAVRRMEAGRYVSLARESSEVLA